jgi:uncharacterized protein (TIGR03437 family)
MGKYLKVPPSIPGRYTLSCSSRASGRLILLLPVMLLALWAVTPACAASTYQIDTVAGTDSVGDNGPAGLASLVDANGVCADPAGNVYVADTGNNRIRKVDVFGTITTIAGTGVGGFSGDGGPATKAQIQQPYGIAVDPAGTLYIADLGNNRIRKIAPNGLISTFPNDTLKLNAPRNVALDAAGNLYIAEFGGNRVLRVDTNGVATVVAGIGVAGFDAESAPATATRINAPAGMYIDASGTLFFADSGNSRIRKVVSGILTTVLGGASDNTKNPAQLYLPTAVIVDPTGVMWIADSGNFRVRKLVQNSVTSVSGNGRDLAFDPSGNVLQVYAGTLKRLLPNNTLITLVGEVSFSFHGDGGPAVNAALKSPLGVAVDSSGNLWIADFGNYRVRRVMPNGFISTVVGNYLSDNLQTPSGIALDSAGTLYIADRAANQIRRLPVNGTVTAIAGTGDPGNNGDGGPALQAQFHTPNGLTVDGFGNLVVADTGNSRIRKIMPSGLIDAFAGTNVQGYSGNFSSALQAQFIAPTALCTGLGGYVYIADTGNHMLRRVSVDGTISAVAGSGVQGYSGDGGPALNAKMYLPRGCAVDAIGNVYVADSGNNVVRVVTPDGNISTIAGNGTPGFSGDGGAATQALLQTPYAVAVDSQGRVYVADTGNNRIRRLTPTLPLFGELTQSLGWANAASLQSGPVAPGSVVSIFGSGLGPLSALTGTLQASSIIASQLGDTQVFFDNTPAALFYVQDSQINAQVPFETAGRTTVKMDVRIKGLSVGSTSIPIASAAPGIFTWNGGTGLAVAMNGSTLTLNGASTPAPQTSVVIVFGTGGGATNPSGVDGRIPDTHPAALVLPVSATIGGQPASVPWAGDSSGNPGMTEFDIVVPSNAPSGPQQVVVTIGGISSQPGALVYIQ